VYDLSMSIEHLGAAIEQRRDALGWTQRDLSDASGVSLTTISAIERGAREHFQSTTLTALDRALGWPTGQSLAILRDDSTAPTVAASHGPARHLVDALLNVVEHLSDEQAQRLVLHAQQLRAGGHQPMRFGGTILDRRVIERGSDLVVLATYTNDDGLFTATQTAHDAEGASIDRPLAPGDTFMFTFQQVD
jgi:transcriptional regulator with XRE-family HTH domain